MHHLHHFYFVKLVLANHATGISATAARFRAEARRMCGKPDGQIGTGHDLVGHRAGKRDFRGGNKIQLFFGNRISLLVYLGFIIAPFGHPEHVLFELGQLARAKQGGAVHNIRGIAFGITVFGSVQV